jgi:hypothetical protein
MTCTSRLRYPIGHDGTGTKMTGTQWGEVRCESVESGHRFMHFATTIENGAAHPVMRRWTTAMAVAS